MYNLHMAANKDALRGYLYRLAAYLSLLIAPPPKLRNEPVDAFLQAQSNYQALTKEKTHITDHAGFLILVTKNDYTRFLPTCNGFFPAAEEIYHAL